MASLGLMAAVIDQKLRDKMRARFLATEGEGAHCYVRHPSASTADIVGPERPPLPATRPSQTSEEGLLEPEHPQQARAERAQSFAMNTPPSSPGNSPRESLSDPATAPETGGTGNIEAANGPGVRAQSLCSSDDEHEQGDCGSTLDELHYELQFDLLNSLPREKAVELARALARSEEDRQQASAESKRLRQKVQQLRRQSSTGDPDRTPSTEVSPKVESSPPAAQAKKPGFSLVWILAAVVALVALVGGAFLVHLRQAEQQPLSGAVLQAPVPVVQEPQEPPARAASLQQPEPLAEAVKPEEVVTPSEGLSVQVEEPANEELQLPSSHKEEVAAPGAVEALPPEVAAEPEPPPQDPVQHQVPVATPFVWEDRPLSAVIVPESLGIHLIHPCLAQEPGHQGDATAELAHILNYHPGLQQVYRLGMFVINTALYNGQPVNAHAALSLRNNGRGSWPPGTSLRLTHGSGYTVHSIDVQSEVHPGQSVEFYLHFKFEMAGGVGGNTETSAWALEVDGNPFGPLMLLEAVWAW